MALKDRIPRCTLRTTVWGADKHKTVTTETKNLICNFQEHGTYPVNVNEDFLAHLCLNQNGHSLLLKVLKFRIREAP